MGRWSRGVALLKASWAVLRSDTKLLAFPALSLVGVVLVIAASVLPFAIWPALFDGARHGHGPATVSRAPIYLVMFVFYFATNFVVVFFNTALISCVLGRFQGRTPTVIDGLRGAAARLPQIIGWAAFSASVGLLLKALEQRLPFVGKIIARIVGAAWGAVTYLVVPVLAYERLGPTAAVRRSAELIRKTWGENLVGTLGLGVLGLLLVLPGFVMIALGGYMVAHGGMAPFFIGCLLAVGYWIAIGIIMGALNQIFVASAYVYAVDGRLPAGFSEEILTTTFRTRR
jgi:hypothetical protein